MAASDYVPIFFKNRLHLAGRPQMGSHPSFGLRPADRIRGLRIGLRCAAYVPRPQLARP
ncbi:MAG: hypothetical protein JWP25_2171 [Bradyrhizobium sp.]|nr:hypothetical protein [Bradyrhizobium sp.]